MEKYLIDQLQTIKTALKSLDQVHGEKILFVIDKTNKLVGTLTDGDIRRGLIREISLEDPVSKCMNKGFRFLKQDEFTLSRLDELRDQLLALIPVVDEQFQIVRLINIAEKKSLLPIDAVIMAGGKGKRLKHLTKDIPKPLLKVGGKSIIEHNIKRLADYGIENLIITINHFGQQIIDHLGDGKQYDLSITYSEESKPLGTIGVVGSIEDFQHQHVLIVNSDLLTTINYEEFYRVFVDKDADMLIASIPYKVDIPYGVLEEKDGQVIGLKEKPSYTYYSNAGIYLIKRDCISLIPKNEMYNANDLMEALIKKKKKVVAYQLLDYWLDIGKIEDYKKAQRDIKYLEL